MTTRVATPKGILAGVALAALALLGLVTGWTEAIFGWAITNLAEELIPGYAEWKAQ